MKFLRNRDSIVVEGKVYDKTKTWSEPGYYKIQTKELCAYNGAEGKGYVLHRHQRNTNNRHLVELYTISKTNKLFSADDVYDAEEICEVYCNAERKDKTDEKIKELERRIAILEAKMIGINCDKIIETITLEDVEIKE